MNSDWESAWISTGGGVGPVETWMKKTVHAMDMNMMDPDQSNTVLLSSPPSMVCKRYAKMQAYGNHWRVDDDISRRMDTFDSGVACLEANEQSAGTGKDYVGVLKDIFLLDYDDIKTPVIVFSCVWKRRYDNQRKSTYVRDSIGFLVVNFRFNTSKSVDPFVFPSQCNQVFFADDDLQPAGSQWKVILRKEARSRRKVEEDDDVFIATNGQNVGSIPSIALMNHLAEPDLTGAIILNDAKNALALSSFNVPEKRVGRQKTSAQVRVSRRGKRKASD